MPPSLISRLYKNAYWAGPNQYPTGVMLRPDEFKAILQEEINSRKVYGM